MESVDTINEPLTYHLDLGDIRQQMGMKAPNTSRNVGEPERLASMIGGGALAIIGLSRRTPLGVGLGLLGAALLYRGTGGTCPIYKKLGINTR